LKERELALYRKGYLPDNKNNDAAKELATKFEAYYNETAKIALVIFNVVVKALGGNVDLAKEILPLSESDLSTSIVRAFNYFECPPHTVNCAPHNDAGLLTLVPSNCPGLQVYSVCGNCGMGWENTHKGLDPTDIVVLCGQSFTEFSNGFLNPSLHRVVSELNPLQSNFGTENSEEKKTTKGKKSKKAELKSNLQQTQVKPKIGRISLPFLLRAKNDVPMNASLIGLDSFGKTNSRLVGEFLDEERRRKQPGLY